MLTNKPLKNIIRCEYYVSNKQNDLINERTSLADRLATYYKGQKKNYSQPTSHEKINGRGKCQRSGLTHFFSHQLRLGLPTTADTRENLFAPVKKVV